MKQDSLILNITIWLLLIYGVYTVLPHILILSFGLLAYFSSSSQTGSSFVFTGLYTLMLSGAMIYTSFILRKRTVNALYFFTILGVFEIAYFIDIYQKPSMASIVEFVILGWQILALIYLWINKNKLFLRD